MSSKNIYCEVCDKTINSKGFSAHLKSILHKNNCVVQVSDNILKINSAFRNRVASYRVVSNNQLAEGSGDEAALTHALPRDYILSLRNYVKQVIDAKLATFNSLKVNFEFFAQFYLPKDDTTEIKSFSTENYVFFQNTDFNEIFSKVVDKLLNKISEFQERDSGWSFLSNKYLEVNINKYNPLRASNYIELPTFIKNKRACINIRNNDNFCFLWSIMAALFPKKKNADRVSSYPHFNDILNTANMTFPVSLRDIRTFENNNENFSVNVYGIKSGKYIVGPLYKTKQKKSNHINLLYFENGTKTHYCLIKDLARLLSVQITKHHGKLFFCDECLLFFNNKETLESHLCGGVATRLPKPGTLMQFNHFERMQYLPFTIYADFESFLEPCEQSEEHNLTVTTQKHVPAAFGYYIVCSYDSNLNRYRTYRGPHSDQVFVDYLQKDVLRIKSILKKEVPMVFTDKDLDSFNKAKHCHICSGILLDDRVRDHCHLTGIFRGAAHSYCNLRFALPKFVPVFFHNLSGYDSHLFIKQLGETNGSIKVVAKNKEKYISFTKCFKNNDDFIAVRFVDSFNFLSTSLDKLVNNLNKDDFIHLKTKFRGTAHFELMRRKGVYPYEHVKGWESYTETSLPERKCFYSSLTREHITDSDYQHAINVWQTFNLTNLGEYTDIYLKSDVLLLADIFESFRKACMENYRLDPAFYLTAPSLSFDAMLLKTKIKLELIHDLEIYRMIQTGIRGGVCLCSNRYAKANNKYLADYNPKIPSNFLLYIDCNNLYGYAMCNYLPCSDFKFMQELEILQLDILKIPHNSDVGYILEVDLEYPVYLHNIHNDLPFCPQNFIPPGSKTKKLIPNLYDKFRYVIHYIHLQTCISHGLILKKIHRVIQFKQSPFLKQYIDLNTNLRQTAKSQFEQDFFKLLNNSIFGKTLENVEKRINVRLVNKWSDTTNKTNKLLTADKLIAKPNFHSITIFSENLAAMQLKKDCVVLDKPIYIGFTVLELSKSHMYDFHYKVMKPFYKDKIKLCYTDTDSFLYSIQTNDVYRDVRLNFLQYFDTSNYPKNNAYKIEPKNNKIPGLFKDELGGQNIEEFVGLRSKLYCIKSKNGVLKKAKGVQKAAVRSLSFSDYKRVLKTGEIVRRKNVFFKSLLHQIFTKELNKVALASSDDKRIVLRNKINTLSYGHCNTIF